MITDNDKYNKHVSLSAQPHFTSHCFQSVGTVMLLTAQLVYLTGVLLAKNGLALNIAQQVCIPFLESDMGTKLLEVQGLSLPPSSLAAACEYPPPCMPDASIHPALIF